MCTIPSSAWSSLLVAVLVACSTSSGTTPRPDARVRADVPAALPSFEGTAYDAATNVKLPSVQAEDHASLHNVFRLGSNIVSGSEPHGEDAFRILQKMGIRTVLSVDGKVPDEALGKRFGMKYVHVPIQYKGISKDEIARIAKTFREQEGPFFVHCFHGRHRGPAAAAIGRLVLDRIPREQAIAEMRQWCGTSKTYEGLYRTIAHAEIPSVASTAKMEWSFPAANPLDGIPGSMVPIVRARDNLRDLAKRDWKTDPNHPDVDALNEASKLLSFFEQANRLDMSEYEDDFRGWMDDSVRQSRQLRDAIRSHRANEGSLELVHDAYKAVTQTCRACHDEYRN